MISVRKKQRGKYMNHTNLNSINLPSINESKYT